MIELIEVPRQMESNLKRPSLLEPLTLGGSVKLRNRIVMAPMTTWAGNDDGTVSDEEEAYYRVRVKDVGLVITGCTHIQPNGIGFPGEFASYDDKFIPSLKRLADAAKSGGASAILQIFHAGVKTSPNLVSDIVAASSVPGDSGPFAPSAIPRELSEEEVVKVISAFGDATRRAIAAGFDGVELHGAHGFLLQNFFSPYFNRRIDRWGGTLENRARFPLGVVEKVRKVIDTHAKRSFVLGYRISPEEMNEGGLRIDESISLADKLIDAGIDYLHLSLNNALETQPIQTADRPTILKIMCDRFSGRIPLMAAGQIRTPEQAERAIATGLSLVAIGRGLVMSPDWASFALEKDQGTIANDVAASDAARLRIPAKLWSVIEARKGWFPIRTSV